MFAVAKIDFAWESSWDSLEMKSVYQDAVFWILQNVIKSSYNDLYEIPWPDTGRYVVTNELNFLFAAFPREIANGWLLFDRENRNFSDRKIEEILVKFLFSVWKRVPTPPTIDEIMELLFARASHWSDKLTIKDLLPQLTSGRMIQVHDQSPSGGLPLNVIAEQVLFYKRPIRSDEQHILARALIDLGWRRHRTAQTRRWIAPPDFPTKDPGKLRWHYR
ncbi:hypothetical protein [Gluconobacter japonicus]|uniref:hypothetical protein n=1 Tax=Gluconobacter japonicus TaxID=376620 RepID=UPI0039EA1A8A